MQLSSINKELSKIRARNPHLYTGVFGEICNTNYYNVYQKKKLVKKLKTY